MNEIISKKRITRLSACFFVVMLCIVTALFTACEKNEVSGISLGDYESNVLSEMTSDLSKWNMNKTQTDNGYSFSGEGVFTEYTPSVQLCKINGTVDKKDNLSSVSLEFNSIFPDACRNFSISMVERFVNEPGSTTLVDMMTIPPYLAFGREIMYFSYKDADSREENLSEVNVFEILSKSINSPQIINGWEIQYCYRYRHHYI